VVVGSGVLVVVGSAPLVEEVVTGRAAGVDDDEGAAEVEAARTPEEVRVRQRLARLRGAECGAAASPTALGARTA
jgi:hypothetical protein